MQRIIGQLVRDRLRDRAAVHQSLKFSFNAEIRAFDEITDDAVAAGVFPIILWFCFFTVQKI